MPGADELISILIINFNGGAHLSECLTALERQSYPRHLFEVIVWDNASRDGSAEQVPDKFPWVRLIRSKTNLGFAGGNVAASDYAHGRWLLLLNNDTIPDPFWLEELCRQDGPIVWNTAASKLVFAHDPCEINSAGLFLLRDGRGADRGFRTFDAGQFEQEQEVFAGCGAALLLKQSTDPVLNPEYFVYYEDLDAGWRHRLAGQRCLYRPRSLVRHVHGAAAGDCSPLFRYYVERNRALTAARNGDLFLAIFSSFVLLAKVAQSAMKAALASPARRKAEWLQAQAVAAAWSAYLIRLPTTVCRRLCR